MSKPSFALAVELIFSFFVGSVFAGTPRDLPELHTPVIATETKSVLRDMEVEMGKILAYDQAPAIHQMLTKVFRRVATALEKKVKSVFVPVNYLFILDSPHKNAFVYQPPHRGVRVATNLVFITTAMIRQLIDLDPMSLEKRYPGLSKRKQVEVEIETGMLRLAGILAHELAHPLDELMLYDRHETGLSIEKEYGERGAQALELKTDVLGALLARDANIPDRSVLDAHERTLDVTNVGSGAAAALATHPDNSLRMTAMRMFLTIHRLRAGENQDAAPFQVSDFDVKKVTAELERFAVSGGPLPWVEPRDLKNLLLRLRTYSSLPSSHQELEYNRLILTLNREIAVLEAKPGGLPRSIKSDIVGIFRLMGSKSILINLWGRDERAEVLKALGDSQHFLDLPTHADSLDKLAFYRDPEYLLALPKTRSIQTHPNGQHEEKQRDLWLKEVQLRSHYMPPDIFIQEYGPTLAAVEMNRILDHRSYAKSETTQFRGWKLLIGFLSHLGKEAFSKGDMHMLALFLASPRYDMIMPFFLKSYSSHSGAQEANKEFEQIVGQIRRLAKIDSEARRHWDFLRRFALEFWNRRGDLMQAELMMATDHNDFAIDWELIADILDMDKQQMIRDLKATFSASLTVQNFQALGKFVWSSEARPLLNLRKIHLKSPWDERTRKAMPLWYDSRIGQNLVSMRRNPSFDQQFYNGLQLLVAPVVALDPNVRDMVYRTHVQEYLARTGNWRKENLISRLIEMETSFAKLWWTAAEGYTDRKTSHVSPLILAEAISASTLSQSEKRLLLKFMFARDGEFPVDGMENVNAEFYKWTNMSEATVQRIYDLLEAHHIVFSPSHLGVLLKNSPHNIPFVNARTGVGNQKENIYQFNPYFQFVDRISPTAVTKERMATLDWDELIRELDLLNTPLSLYVDRSESNTANIQEARNVFADRASQLANKRNFLERMGFFLKATATGNSLGTDYFFDRFLFPFMVKDGRYFTRLKVILIHNRIQSAELRLRIAKSVLEASIVRLESVGSPSADQLYSLISDLNFMAPQGSLAKDAFLEEIAWRLDLNEMKLGAFIEDQKTSNWGRENAMIVNLGSTIASAIFKLSFEARNQLLTYLIDPLGSREGLPQAVVEQITENVMDDLITDSDPQRRQLREQALREQASNTSRTVKLQVELFIRDASPTERIPFIELVLTSGPNAFINRSDYPLNVSRAHLGYEPDSVHEKMFLAYLAVIPRHEIAPSLAYLLSQAKEDKRTVASLFELFGTVGIKFGQLSSIWKIFGPEVAEETRHLKDHAPAMSRHEIFERMRSLLNQDLNAHLNLIEILGAASVKTVVRIEYRGRRGVMAMQSAAIHNQIATNLNLGLRFLEELEKRNLVRHSRMLGTLVAALREQLKEEVNFKNEAVKYDYARRMMDDLNVKMAKSLNGWKFEVPELMEGMPLMDDVAFYDVAEGKPYDKLTAKQREEVGPLLVRASLAMLFRYGFFDADRHKGNWLINVKTKTIYSLDFGQLEDFRPDGGSDPRVILVEFMRAITSRNIDGIYRQFKAMAIPESKIPNLTRELRENFLEALAEDELPDRMIEVLTAATEAGFDIEKRFSFGAMKGLLILFGEQYVDQATFQNILLEEGMGWMARGMSGDKSVLICEEALTKSS